MKKIVTGTEKGQLKPGLFGEHGKLSDTELKKMYERFGQDRDIFQIKCANLDCDDTGRAEVYQVHGTCMCHACLEHNQTASKLKQGANNAEESTHPLCDGLKSGLQSH